MRLFPIISLDDPAQASVASRGPKKRRALTYMELLIALCITVVVSGVLAILINSTAAGTANTNDGRRALVRLQAVKSALQDEFINTRAILATGSNYVVYWIGDQSGAPTPANNAVNYSEMRLLEVDASGNLIVYRATWPGYTNAAIISADTTCSASTSWYATCTTLKAGTNFTGTTIATNVSSMTLSLDAASPTSAKIINISMDFNDGVVTRQLVLTTALANPLAPY